MTESWLSAAECSLDEFRQIVEVETDPAQYPFSRGVDNGAVVYDGDAVRRALADGRARELFAELAAVFAHGPGIAVFADAVDTSVIDSASAEFNAMIEEEREPDGPAADHFAPAGANDRVWNTIEKLALRNPQVFADYYANEIIAAASTAWLGPNYQITAQVNVVNPGGQAQQPHRDYHLGFLDNAAAERFPAHVHRLSPALTLQGAIAHCDMPIDTGPTMYLPHSHKYAAGYVAWRRDDFVEYFAQHYTQSALAKGDAVFFNPAVFHGAGTNVTADVRRIANLLQVGSAFGRTMESVDRRAMSLAVYPVLLEQLTRGVDRAALDRVVAASAEGYPFPGNLDEDPPLDGLVPMSQADLVRRALDERWTTSELLARLGE